MIQHELKYTAIINCFARQRRVKDQKSTKP